MRAGTRRCEVGGRRLSRSRKIDRPLRVGEKATGGRTSATTKVLQRVLGLTEVVEVPVVSRLLRSKSILGSPIAELPEPGGGAALVHTKSPWRNVNDEESHHSVRS